MKNRQNLSWLWDMFDYIGVVCYTGYVDRVRRLRKELGRVGLEGRVVYHWDYPNPFEEKLISSLHFQCERTKKAFHCGYNNYSIIKTAYSLGCKTVLVLEDDIRFLNDIDALKKVVLSLPKDYDLAMMDKNWPSLEYSFRDTIIKRRINECWIEFDKFLSSGCYSMSRTGMERFIKVYEKSAIGAGGILKSNDQYFNRQSLGNDLKLYAAHPNLCCQSYIGTGWCPTDLRGYWNRHEGAGMRQVDYNLDYPVVTNSTFSDLLYDYISKQKAEKAYSRVFAPLNTYLMSGALGCDVIGSVDDSQVSHVGVWGSRGSDTNCLALQVAYRWDAGVLLMEDGFIRSLNTWVGSNGDVKNRSWSILLDTDAYYFDATRVSRIEKMINDFNLVISPEQRVEARRIIDKIVSNKISKYNHQPIYTPKIGREGVRKVLVVDQSYGDYSIKRGMADDSTFEKMLRTAIDENPDADILVKTHPDTLAGKKAEKKGYYQDLKEHDNIYKVTFPINPYSLMELCDKVYVCSSQFGFEALMAGKEVHVFGMPFYAGWGLTIDDQHLERRANMRTLEELFYIFYCMYTHWVDPEKGCETTIDAVIDKMISFRDEYKKENSPSQRTISRAPFDDGFGYSRPVFRTHSSSKTAQLAPVITTRKPCQVIPRVSKG